MLLNNKITGNKIAQKQKTTSHQTPKMVQGSGVNIMETYMAQFEYDPISTNINYEFIPTQPYEERSAKERGMKPIERLKKENKDFLQDKALTAVNTVPSHHARIGMPEWRQFTDSQIRKVEDDLQSPLSMDSVTIFGSRPPELRFVMHQGKYARWFFREKPKPMKLHRLIDYCKNVIHDELSTCYWIDATTSMLQVRRHAIDEVIDYLEQAPVIDFGGTRDGPRNKRSVMNLFRKIQIAANYVYDDIQPPFRSIHFQTLKDICKRFVCEEDKTHLPVIWMRPVRPTLTSRFLISLILSLGAFVDEYDLFACGSLRETFIKARLLDDSCPLDSAKKLMRKYFLEQLVILPAGTRTFDMYCVTAYNTIKDLFVHNKLYSNELPTVLYCRLHDETAASIVEHQREKQFVLIKYLVQQMKDAGITSIPTEEEFQNATLQRPVNWDITSISRPASQPIESYEEQKKVLRVAKSQIDVYKEGKRECTKGLCTVGAGGVGKTMCGILFALLYAAGQGLTIGTTALMSERAKELAGEHFNSLLCVPSNSSLTPGQLAERAISNLYRNPEKLEFLRRADVMGIDEGGCIPAEFWAIFDIVLRYIRNSSKPFGGLLMKVSQDNLQICPFKGRHPLLSPLFVSSFIFKRLVHSVRAALDPNWQRVQIITRLSVDELNNEQIKQEFVHLLCTKCTWVTSETSSIIPSNALFCFGKHAPIREYESKMFVRLRDVHCVQVHAQDEERTVEGNFIPASQPTTTDLNRKVREPEVLYLYKGGRYQLTYNKRKKKRNEFSNTQLAMLFEIPSQDVLSKFGEIKLLVAPPGNKYVPDKTDTKQHLKSIGWTDKMVGIPPGDRVQYVRRGLRGKRRQYGLRHHVGSTIHAVMGATLKSLVSKVEPGRGNNYSLWLRSQVVVLLSRTRFAKETIFISDNPQRTAETIYDVLQRTSPFHDYIIYLLNKLCREPSDSPLPTEIDFGESNFCPCNVALPHDTMGQVYILLSLADSNFVYIGSTSNIIERLQQHNTGFGSQQTAPPSLRPWALLAYVTGFDGHRINLHRFENRWIMAKANYQNNSQIAHSVEGIVHLANDVIRDMGSHLNLRLVHCGTINRARTVLHNIA